jgi:HAD superfamily hydrolase (TIGR01509 family)
MFPPLHSILFDLDGTLRHNEPTGFETFIEYLTELGWVLTPEQRAHAERWTHYYWSIAPELQSDIEELGADTPEFWRRHAERQVAAFNLNGGQEEALAERVNQMFVERYRPVNRVDADVRPTLEHLRAAGYVVGLVSNRSVPLGPVAAEIGLADLFHFTLAAGEIGAFKPAPEIFLKAVALAGCAPAEAVYVGDNFYADVEGARGAGLHAVLIDPRGLFPDPGCRVIRAIGDLRGLLGA